MSEYTKRASPVKTILIIVLCLIIAGGIAAGIMYLTDRYGKPESESGYIQEGLMMREEAELRMQEPRGVRFTVSVTPELYREVSADKNKTFGVIVAPLSFYTQVDTGKNFGEIDWVSEFESKGLSYEDIETPTSVCITEPNGKLTEYRNVAYIYGIPYKGVNTELLGIGYVKTTDGENVKYKYAGYPEGVSYKDCARSYGYVAALKLNENAVLNTYYSEEDLTALRKIVNDSADFANGLEAPTDDDSTYTVSLNITEKTITAGKEFTITADMKEKVKTPVWWQSSDTSVAEVNNGTVTALKEGTAVISAFVAGKEYTCTVTVEAAES